MDNAQQIKDNIDQHLLPKEPDTVGEDWRGEDLYGHEYGYLINGVFVLEEEVPDYIDRIYQINNAKELLN